MSERLKYVNRLPLGLQLRRIAWNVTAAILFRPTPHWALHGWRRALLRAFGARIGKGCRIDPACSIWAPWNLTLGDYCALAAGVYCYNVAPITLKRKVTVSQRSFLCTASHDILSLLRPLTLAPIMVESHVWIAAEAMIHPGVRIGEGAVIGARACVMRDVKPWIIAAGLPAREVGIRKVQDAALDLTLEHYPVGVSPSENKP